MIIFYFGKTIFFQTKPKRKFLNHLNHGGREKGKRHEHTKQDVNRLEIYSRKTKGKRHEHTKQDVNRLEINSRKTKVNGILLPIRTSSSY